jgi:hypothetical protein
MNSTEGKPLHVDLNEVLIRTRGKTWDYSFVLCPRKAFIDGWYDVHVKVFEGKVPDNLPINDVGVLTDAMDRPVFVATAFADPIRRDDVGRPIVNYIIWFPNQTNSGIAELSVPSDWGSQVMAALEVAREKTFALPVSTGIETKIREDFERVRDVANPILLEGTGLPIKNASRISIGRKLSETALTTNPKRGIFALLVLLGFILLLWIVTRRRE